MEDKKVIFDHPIGTFKNSVRAYREYKKEWRAKMEVKLANEYTFKTEHDIVYSVDFKEELTLSPIPAYWFDLTNLSHKPSPNDPKVRETVIRIIVE